MLPAARAMVLTIRTNSSCVAPRLACSSRHTSRLHPTVSTPALLTRQTHRTLFSSRGGQRTRSTHLQVSDASTESVTAKYDLQSVSGEDALDIDNILKRVGEITVEPLEGSSRYMTPQRLRYTVDGTPRAWDMVRSMDSVAVVVYHRELNAAIIVRQFRPAVHASAVARMGGADVPLSEGVTYELCAGLADKQGQSLGQIAAEEVLEECGYRVRPEDMRRLTSYASAIGLSGSRQTLFAVEVDESMHEAAGGGLAHDGEAIQVLALPLRQLQDFLMDDAMPKSASLMFGFQWLQAHYA